MLRTAHRVMLVMMLGAVTSGCGGPDGSMTELETPRATMIAITPSSVIEALMASTPAFETGRNRVPIWMSSTGNSVID